MAREFARPLPHADVDYWVTEALAVHGLVPEDDTTIAALTRRGLSPPFHLNDPVAQARSAEPPPQNR